MATRRPTPIPTIATAATPATPPPAPPIVAMPPTGSQPSFTANSTISMMPSQKLGAAKKNMAAIETSVSHTVRTLTEATTPAATPTASASAMLDVMSSKVAGRCTEIAWITGMFWR